MCCCSVVFVVRCFLIFCSVWMVWWCSLFFGLVRVVSSLFFVVFYVLVVRVLMCGLLNSDVFVFLSFVLVVGLFCRLLVSCLR